ncbi:hypothetical protein [Streptomyces sp. NPDC046332]|uniref:hypothetical protein n=1 Tax=Streptomyces sp. NPDC046332 TaxID=3155133 RepID=UPI0033F87411
MPVPLTVDAGELPNSNTAATMPMANAVCFLVPAGALQYGPTTVPFRLMYPLTNGKAVPPQVTARIPRNRSM